MKLGDIKKTPRGFSIIEFSDIYGVKCSLQASSIALQFAPGTSAIWLGSVGDSKAPRMHLDRKKVKALMGHLENWLKNGEF